MKTVLYGGAFDPVHAGHVFVVHEALRLMTSSTLILIPTGLPNPNFDKHLSASDADRVAMLQLAFAGVPDVSISDFELSCEPRPSYFVDTLEGLRSSLGVDKPALLLGEDQLFSFPQWHRYQDILDQVELWFVPRAGRHRSGSPEIPARALFDINPFDSLSSTLIRNRLRQGLSVEGLVPPSVAGYIGQHGLYRGQ
ncbi:nicotinate (nicotinamide) nucleotide adenylyltransferase [Candidatus Cryosericum septentrionale]|jgi:nicotinate-nucleotide adenylyltransferase|uniref:Probable nicotinate-nucleotide adenylyltransferase n=1 Tax=Candidatus Cryosericum septentrionale TaxID=2290913 RepID=A0A398DPK4_9BACT|nr:nicotinate (nicotinamide) nucleotide adenylyltransferase [Candidatus Cryosericum septentrionale]RIE16920.1 nicotinate (nicotinamide) nucleotide adenylyltransferase [Candidatus Cryosericum septentrionale]